MSDGLTLISRPAWKTRFAMKQISMSLLLLACGLILSASAQAQGNNEEGYAKEVYTGTIFNVSGGGISTGFTLTLTSRTTDEEAQRDLSILASEGQEDLMKAIRKTK